MSVCLFVSLYICNYFRSKFQITSDDVSKVVDSNVSHVKAEGPLEQHFANEWQLADYCHEKVDDSGIFEQGIICTFNVANTTIH